MNRQLSLSLGDLEVLCEAMDAQCRMDGHDLATWAAGTIFGVRAKANERLRDRLKQEAVLLRDEIRSHKKGGVKCR